MKKLVKIDEWLNQESHQLSVDEVNKLVGGQGGTTINNCTYSADNCTNSDDSATCNDGHSDDAGGNEDDALTAGAYSFVG